MRTMVLTRFALLFVGCSSKSLVTVESFSDGVHRISSDLLRNSDFEREQNKTVLFTSMVNIDDFKQSSKFGRLFSESLMTDFKIHGWRVIEYRGNDIVTLAQNGEFMLNRGRLRHLKGDMLILLGTYGVIQDVLVVNTRLIDAKTYELVSAASVTIDDKEIIEMTKEHEDKNVTLPRKYTIDVYRDDCKDEEFCWRSIP